MVRAALLGDVVHRQIPLRNIKRIQVYRNSSYLKENFAKGAISLVFEDGGEEDGDAVV